LLYLFNVLDAVYGQELLLLYLNL